MSQTQSATRASLILRLQDTDDVVAWDEFTSIYGPVIYRIALRRGLQPADAENLSQEVFLSVANSIADWLNREDRGRFRAWLLRITRNRAFDMLTQRATRGIGCVGSEAERAIAKLEAPQDLTDALDLEYERSVFRWAATKVRNAVAEQTWSAFWMTTIEGISIEDAARQLQTRPGNIYFARSRVMARMKELVKRFGDES